MNKKYTKILFTIMLAAVVVLAGCGANQEPKEAVKSATSKATEMTSYALTSKVVINNLSISESEDAPEMSMVLAMLKDAELNIDGVFQNDPMQAEFTLGVELKGDMEVTYNIPMVMTTEKLYVKVPNIPMLGIPETLVNKYIELDMKKLAEEEGVEWNPASMDLTKSQQFSNEVMDAVLAEYDEATYFKNLEKDAITVPEDVEVQQIVQFQVTNENVKEAITILVNNALPKVIDIMSKAEYKDMLQLTDEDLTLFKEELSNTDQNQMAADLEELKDHLTINTFNINTAINKDGIPAYQEGNVDVVINDPDTKETMNLAMTMTNHYKDINKTPEFKIGIPAGDEVVTMEQFQEMMSEAYSY
ncbi:hypothetical protein [Paenibacillus sp. Marseille-Q4541]|uniref:hypothetical protein n=1 Tax=Paenibacillus sp. Marseille-Q4541 TaxID=2831522 RepID=UPI001BAA74F5|nr:hypothetical protein [Paenibacillus sp. Marseille-Q4541]